MVAELCCAAAPLRLTLSKLEKVLKYQDAVGHSFAIKNED